uniref:Isochorismatase-like domain-containing protein n=1 Tax=viral metagenome TaxID=1070528 RepID=A0A6C0KY61_9ZZZZ
MQNLKELLNENGYVVLDIDSQIDFHAGGSLGVLGQPDEVPGTGEGAISDSQKIAKLILENPPDIFWASLDTHTPTHIAHSKFWLPEPPENTIIKFDNEFDGCYYLDGTNKIYLEPKSVKNIPDEVFKKWVFYYTKTLKEGGKFELFIWPFHCLENDKNRQVHKTLGNALKILKENRKTDVVYVVKGQNEATEMYSIFQAEIPISDENLEKAGIPEIYRIEFKNLYRGKCTNTGSSCQVDTDAFVSHAFLNTSFNFELYYQIVREIQNGSVLAVCGEAASHCVNWSLRDLIEFIKKDTSLGTLEKRQELLSRIVLLTDATSIVNLGYKPYDEKFANDTINLLEFCAENGVNLMTVSDFSNLFN